MRIVFPKIFSVRNKISQDSGQECCPRSGFIPGPHPGKFRSSPRKFSEILYSCRVLTPQPELLYSTIYIFFSYSVAKPFTGKNSFTTTHSASDEFADLAMTFDIWHPLLAFVSYTRMASNSQMPVS